MLLEQGCFVFQLMIQMPYNRALETEADKVGLELAAKVYQINIYHCCEAFYKIILNF